MLGVLTIIAWTAAFSAAMFGTMKALGVLRVKEAVELAGLDSIKHGEPAYPHAGYCDGEHPYGKNDGESISTSCVFGKVLYGNFLCGLEYAVI